MRDTDGTVGGIDALAAVATGAIDVDAQVARVDLDVSFFGFGEDGDGDGAGVDAALALSDGDALDAVDAGFKFELGVRRVTLDFEDNFFVATGLVG